MKKPSILIAATLMTASMITLAAGTVLAQGYDGLIAAPPAKTGNAPSASIPKDIYGFVQSTTPAARGARINYKEQLAARGEERTKMIADRRAGFEKATKDSFAPAIARAQADVAKLDAINAQKRQERMMRNGGVPGQAPAAFQPSAQPSSAPPSPVAPAPAGNRQEYQSPY